MMKIHNRRTNVVLTILLSLLSLNACDYLEVIPVEQANMGDMMTDDESTRAMLYSCYGYLQNCGADLTNYYAFDFSGTDETVLPQEWGTAGSRVQWNAITPSSINEENNYPWEVWYNAIGYCNLFLKLIEENNPVLNRDNKERYIAEVKFLKAYYHFRALQMYGPIPIIDQFMSSNIAKNEIPGRSHFDYCIKYIVDLLDEAKRVLPEQTTPDFYGRATSVICKALKARVLVLAASPLWNGDFPDKTWRNINFETPDYGKELVSFKYEQKKWVNARNACIEAIKAADDIQAKLFDVEDAETWRINHGVGLPIVPGLGGTDAEKEDFQKRVMMLRYMNTTRPDQNNKEIIWGVSGGTGDRLSNLIVVSLPHFILKGNSGEDIGGWGGISPTLYTIEHFYTKNGKLPSEDESFCDKSEWFESANLSNANIINLAVNREPRFYAWLSFDGDEFSTVLSNRKPLYCSMRDPNSTGYNSDRWGTRNYSVTGFMNKKWINPNTSIEESGRPNFSEMQYPATIIRLADLYLLLAECDAHLEEHQDEGIEYLNKIRTRAGVDAWTKTSLDASGKSLLDAVLEERFVEFYMEGSRYYDIRRYVKGKKHMKANCYRGLNAMVYNPSFVSFNTPKQIDQPFDWNDRMYLLPIANKELYANPQMVQAPGY